MVAIGWQLFFRGVFMLEQDAEQTQQQATPIWQPLSSRQRRVAGVLIEKAKTTPDAYPMTLNALANGCNQKSNRSPQMNLSVDEVEEALSELRSMGAVVEVQGGGRVAKFRHLMYEWLGVDKVQLAVMAELLLRGQQTVGELRARAARMEPIADQAALRPVLRSLVEKGLVIELTPEGRGQVVTHGLDVDRELDQIKLQAGSQKSTSSHGELKTEVTELLAPLPRSTSVTGIAPEMLYGLRREFDGLKDEVEQLRRRVLQLEQMIQN